MTLLKKDLMPLPTQTSLVSTGEQSRKSFSDKTIQIERESTNLKSEYAVPSIYFFDRRAPVFVKSHTPSPRGELEITTLKEGSLQVEKLGRGTTWLDTGTHDSLLDASVFVRILEKRQGFKIACLEEIALEAGWIDQAILKTQIEALGKSNYSQYLKQLCQFL